MANLDNQTNIIVDDNRPLAVRRQRRSSGGSNSHLRDDPQYAGSHPHGIATPPQTPKRTKNKVRFSDPGPAIESACASSGLTPFIRRASLSKPRSRRRPSAPARLWNRAGYDVGPASGILQFAPLRQVLDGRVRRRIKRNGLSEETNVIECDKRVEARGRRAEVERLKGELALKDLEVQSMRDEQDIASQIEGESGGSITTNASLSAKVLELEQEIRVLKDELAQRESDGDRIDGSNDWTMAAGDVYSHDNEEEDMMITNYDDGEDMTGNDEAITTATPLNTSFPSPPSTMPNTPCKPACSASAGIQAILPIPDPENEELKSQLRCLQAEVTKLTSAVAFNDDNATRLAEKLSQFIPVNESHDNRTLDSALDTVLTQLALAQSHALEHSTAFSALSTEITSLDFAAASADEALEILGKQFRQARLDLEYLAPGEVAEGFENNKLLGLLVERIRVLLAKVKDRDQSIDQYHHQEVLLRQQLNDRVSVMEGMKSEIFQARRLVSSLREEIEEKETDSERLRGALEGYRAEVSSLESLISRVEEEGRENEQGLRSELDELQARLNNEVAQHGITKAVNEGNEMLLPELERRLTAALEAAAERDSTIAALHDGMRDREYAHGSALALRDARVSELRSEIEMVNEALKSAHSTILSLRKEKQEVSERAERGCCAVRDMLRQLGRAEEMGRGFVDVENVEGVASVGVGVGVDIEKRASAVRMFDARLARRSSAGESGKKRRRYDSGLGFLEEGEEDERTEVGI